ncbi:MAG: hypothetical protein U1E46_05420 [Hyphomicrobiales bacterium]
MRPGMVFLFGPVARRQSRESLIDSYIRTSRLWRSPAPVQVDHALKQFLVLDPVPLELVGIRVQHRLKAGLPLGKRPGRPF